jgi:uncharacterized protein YjiS (DUF1127 family)
METTMTSIGFHNTQRQLRHQMINTATRAIVRAVVRTAQSLATWHKRRRDRAAFIQLLGKEDWVYEDMGISRADAEWAAHLPMQINAARELERLRARGMMGR